MGTQTPGPVALWRSTQQRSVPLALASLVLGSRRSETVLFEIGYGGLARVRRGMGPARRGPIGTTVFAAGLTAAPVVFLRRRVRWGLGPMACAGPSVREWTNKRHVAFFPDTEIVYRMYLLAFFSRSALLE
jgi:hypothetical protein